MAEMNVLNSWKEISSYIGRGVRTVQRWESLYGLPVHRPAGRDRSAVYALRDEIDAWLRLGKMHELPRRTLSPEAASRYQDLMAKHTSLVVRLRETRKQAEHIREAIVDHRSRWKRRISQSA